MRRLSDGAWQSQKRRKECESVKNTGRSRVGEQPADDGGGGGRGSGGGRVALRAVRSRKREGVFDDSESEDTIHVCILPPPSHGHQRL